MRLPNDWHLGYCTNVHRGESWPETFANLVRHTLEVRRRVAAGRPYGIGLRLGAEAARELADVSALSQFRRWLEANDCYVFTINGFPYGPFHGLRVKEQVYAPDWAMQERVEYTRQLFELLAALLPPGMEGSVSTLPCGFKGSQTSAEWEGAVRRNLWQTVEFIAELERRCGQRLHLGLEPEPLCYLETSEETARWFESMRSERPGDDRLDRCLGVTYDACHLAVEFEEPGEALARLRDHGVRISKVHLSKALRVTPTPAVRRALGAFTDPVYMHQVVVRSPGGALRRFRDLEDVLVQDQPASRARSAARERAGEEWRIHFHIPLHSLPTQFFDPGVDRHQTDFALELGQAQLDTTQGHLLGLLDQVCSVPTLCRHFEIETYTWEVLPPELRSRDVVDQLVAEYGWVLARLRERGVDGAAVQADQAVASR